VVLAVDRLEIRRAGRHVHEFAVHAPDAVHAERVRPEASKCEILRGVSGLLMSHRSKPAGVMPKSLRIWCATTMRSPQTSSEFERILLCGSSVWTTIFRLRGSVTSTAVKFFGAPSCPSHMMRLPSAVFDMPMPSPMPPKPPRSCWEINFMFSASVCDADLPGFNAPLTAMFSSFA